MDFAVQAVLFLGIIPALILLYISLKGYDGYYKDRLIYLSFVVGIITGVLVIITRLLVNPQSYLIFFIILFAFIEQLIKLVILNIGRLQYKKETVIYGLSLGLGFGSAYTPFLVIASNLSGQNELTFLSLVTIGSIGFILFHAASGTCIGYGIYSGQKMKYFLLVIIIQIPFGLFAEYTRYYKSEYFAYFQIAIVLYGAIIFVYVIKKIMPRILDKNKTVEGGKS